MKSVIASRTYKFVRINTLLFIGSTNTSSIRRAVIKFDIDGAIPAGATILVGVTGEYIWGSTAGMVANVQQWLDQPASNSGWIIIGNESQLGTSKRFDSREILECPVFEDGFEDN